MASVCLVAVDIRSSHNIGSLFRTAEGFGAEIILVGICPRPKGDSNDDRLPHIIEKSHNTIAKTALGAESIVNWQYFPDIQAATSYLKRRNYQIIAIEQSHKSLNIKDLKIISSTALLLGPEVEGLSDKILNLCDEIYEIPMSGRKESFNVSVAAGIALYQSSLSS